MYTPEVYAAIGEVIAAARSRDDLALASGHQLCDLARELQHAHDMLDGLRAQVLSQMAETEAYADEGAASMAVWTARELRLALPDARKRVAAVHALARLPRAADAVADGSIRLEHAAELSAGMKKAGPDIITDAEPLLVDIAKTSDPSVVRRAIKYLTEIVHPDALDEAYVRGMDKHDVQLHPVGDDGFHLNGFLDPVAGAKVKTWLDAAAAPTDPGDTRTPAQRRVDAFGRLVDTALAHPVPSESGLRPQMHVLVDVETLQRPEFVGPPADITGFGSIGRDLLGYLTCTADTTPVLIDRRNGEGDRNTGKLPQARVLNVGRTSRLATPKQRHAVIARQNGYCAAPGCTGTYLEVHHVAWWHRDGGATDLDNLIGLCTRCHHRTHQEKLLIRAAGDGFEFQRSCGKPIPDHRTQSRDHIRQRLRNALQHHGSHEPRDSRGPNNRPRPRSPAPPSAAEHHFTSLIRHYQHHRPPACVAPP